MADTVTFQTTPVTGVEAPAPDAAAAPAAPLAGTEKALADTKAELTRVQQELAALKKGAAPAADAPASDPAATPDPSDPPAETTDEQQAAKEAVEAAGIDVAPFEQEFATTGDVSEESRAKIAEGLKSIFGDRARSVVDQFVDSQKTVVENTRASYITAGGGEQGYGEMIAWAKTSLPPAEIAAFNASVESGDHNTTLFAIQGLRARYEATKGKAPSLLTPTNTPPAGADVFENTAQMVAAMRDPRYASDPAYRKMVEQKTMRSNF